MFFLLILLVTCNITTYYMYSLNYDIDDQIKLAFFIHKDLKDKINLSIEFTDLDSKTVNINYFRVNDTDKLYNKTVKDLVFEFDKSSYDLYFTNEDIPFFEGFYTLKFICKENNKINERFLKKKDFKEILEKCEELFLYYIRSYYFLTGLLSEIDDNLKKTKIITDDNQRNNIDKQFIELQDKIYKKILLFNIWADNQLSITNNNYQRISSHLKSKKEKLNRDKIDKETKHEQELISGNKKDQENISFVKDLDQEKSSSGNKIDKNLSKSVVTDKNNIQSNTVKNSDNLENSKSEKINTGNTNLEKNSSDNIPFSVDNINVSGINCNKQRINNITDESECNKIYQTTNSAFINQIQCDKSNEACFSEILQELIIFAFLVLAIAFSIFFQQNKEY